MILDDLIYRFGTREVILIELAECDSVKRLKKIEQFGIPRDLDVYEGFSRYDHSIGVMLLLAKLGASVEEQVAGLLHDVSHTAFSHVYDWVIGKGGQEDYQDKVHSEFLKNSTDIVEILRDYKINVEDVSNIEAYSLLEQEVPDLCADRIDYALRQFKVEKDFGLVNLCIRSLKILRDKIIFTSKEAASGFGRAYMKRQIEHWGETNHVIRYHLFSESLKVALDKNIINKDDFLKDDDYIMNKLKEANDADVNKLLNALPNNFQFEVDNENPTLKLRKKFRFIDPVYFNGSDCYCLSEKDKAYRNLLEVEAEKSSKGINGHLTF